jgi:hypothetical protein
VGSDVPSLRIPPRYGPVREFLGVPPALVLLGVGGLFVPHLVSAYWTFNVMVGLVLAISCLGLLVLVGWAREISLTQAGLTGSALYLCMYVHTESEVTPVGRSRQLLPRPSASSWRCRS